MAIIKPFRAVRTSRDKVALVSSKSHEVYTSKKLKAKLKFNPFTFLHVIHPGYKYNKEISGEERFKLVHNRYLEFKENRFFTKDEKPAFYVYKKVTKENVFCGIIAATSVDDYKKDVIKKHEGTIKSREILFEHYLRNTGFNAEPVVVTYPDNDEINTIVEKYKEQRAEYEFTSSDKNLHLLWVIDNEKDIYKIAAAFKKINTLYIADGHHRSSSSYLLAKHKAKENPNHTGEEDYNFFMSYLIPESNLKISEFNRFVKDLNGLTANEFLIALDEYYRIENHGQVVYKPNKKHHFSMYLDGEFYSLYLRKTSYVLSDPLSKLDSEILYRTVLKPILGINDLKNSSKISYLYDKKDSLILKRKVDSGEFKIAFGMVPLSIEEIKEIADANLQMPPKSTYIQPKMRSALTIYEF
tara:strand:+ start:6887 stop:8122 length:1236 start_codon:yes stop_codon:yes gene_type:complete